MAKRKLYNNNSFSASGMMKHEIITFSFPFVYFPEILAHYKGTVTDNKSSGSGMLIYTGMSSPSGDIFIGANPSNTSCILKFVGDSCGEEAQSFLNKFESSTPTDFYASLKLSGMEGLVRLEIPNSVETTLELHAVFEESAAVQTKKIPKVEISNGDLLLGGKTGSGMIRVFGLTPISKDKKVSIINLTGLGLSFKLSDTNSRQMLELLLTNPKISIANITFFYLKGLLSRFSMNNFLDKIREVFLKGIGQADILYPHAKTANRVFSPSGKYVSKSLTGILNKLKDTAFNAETREVIPYWLECTKDEIAQVQGNPALIKAVIDILENILNGPEPNASASTGTGTGPKPGPDPTTPKKPRKSRAPKPADPSPSSATAEDQDGAEGQGEAEDQGEAEGDS